jgi:hypothetical protein
MMDGEGVRVLCYLEYHINYLDRFKQSHIMRNLKTLLHVFILPTSHD